MSLRSLGANDNPLYLNFDNTNKASNKSSASYMPLRNSRLTRVTTGGGALAKNTDSSRVAVVGKESLRIIKVASPEEIGSHHFEPSKNYWEGSGLKADSALTDVVWAHGIYSSKVITSSRNGDLALWDLSRTGSKLERRTRNHLRAIHQISLSPNLPHYCVSGSADGDIRAWDLRDLTRSVLRLSLPSGVRAVAFSPNNSHALQLNLGLDDGSLQRVDLRLGRTKGVLDRLPVAHAGPILSLDWVPPTGMPLSNMFPSRGGDGILESDRNPAGWIASAGLDKTVKIWPAEFTGLFPSEPTYTLAATWPVRRVRFRPGHATELVLVSNAEQVSVVDGGSGATTPSEVMPCAGEVVQIWDVRRENIPKWSIPTMMSDGSVSDVVWGDSRVLWAQHASGTFAQLDIMDTHAPVNSAPRSTVACSSLGMISFALDVVREREIPFEAELNYSSQSSFEGRHGHKLKKLGDATFRPETQNCGTVPLHDSDEDPLPAILTCAKYYRLSGGSTHDLCLVNGKVAEMANRSQASQLWFLAASLIEELVPEMPQGTSSPAAPILMHSISAPSAIPTLNALSQPVSSTPPRKPVVRRAMTESIKGSVIFSSKETAKHLMSSNNGSRRGSPAFIPGIGDSPRLSPSPSPTPSPLRQTIALPVPRALAPHLSFSNGPQNSRPSNAVGFDSRERSSFSSYTRPPAGFDPMARRSSLTPSLLSLTSPSNNSRSPTDTTFYGISGVRKHRIGEGALDGSSDEDEAEDAAADGGDEHDDRETDEDPGTPIRSGSRVRPGILSQPPGSSWAPGPLRDSNGEKEGSSSDDHVAFSSTGRPQFPRRMSLRKKRDRRESNAALRLAHQPSTASIGTVTGHNDTTDELHAIATSVDTVIGGLAPRISFSENVRLRPENQRLNSFQSLPSGHRYRIAMDEKQIRNLGWLSLWETLLELADEGDIQTCAMLGLVCSDTLLFGSATIAYYIQCYLDLLDRLQLHCTAAYVRKACHSPEIRSLTTVNTTIYTSCASCKKPIISPATHIKNDAGKPSGSFSFCMGCQRFSICSICRLPTRGLSFYCVPCGHGGHWTCYRRYRNSYALVDTISPNKQHTKVDTDPGRCVGAPPVGLQESLGSEQAPTGLGSPSLTVGLYPCAAGCGHACSFGN